MLQKGVLVLVISFASRPIFVGGFASDDVPLNVVDKWLRPRYNELHGDQEHMKEEHELVSQLLPLVEADPDLFDLAYSQIVWNMVPTWPGFPAEARQPGFVTSVPRLSADEEAALVHDYFLQKRVYTWGSHRPSEEELRNMSISDEQFRTLFHFGDTHSTDYMEQRRIQYARFDWASKNLRTFVNMMRSHGHDDAAIQGMFNGVPVAWHGFADLFAEFQRDLSQLSYDIQTELGFENVGIYYGGSSVAGFSTNPFKGLKEYPSWITTPNGRSNPGDVDIGIRADGLLTYVYTQMLISHGTYDESVTSDRLLTFVGAQSRHKTDMRFSSRNYGNALGKGFKRFITKWNDPSIFPGGVQVTLSDDNLAHNPWETRAKFGRR